MRAALIKKLLPTAFILLLAAAGQPASAGPQQAPTPTRANSCADLAKQALLQASITTAQWVEAGQYAAPQRGFETQPGMSLAGRVGLPPNPAFCRIAATLKPTPDSDIKIEVWLPRAGWNGKFLAAGNFGWGGAIPYSGMLTGLLDGYATAGNDTGHADSMSDGPPGGRFLLGHPEKLIDYAYRADHLMTVDAKALIKAFYGHDPSHAYWIGCSLGGLEGLIEAKRYPADYEGIVAGAPPNPLTRFNALQLWPDWLISRDPARLIPQAKYKMIHDAVLKRCASPQGQKDGILEQPDKCDFEPRQLQCTGADAPDCLTAPQVDLLVQTYRGPSNPRTGELIFPGPARGSELEMFMLANGGAFSVALDLFRYAAFQDPDWNLADMDWDRSVQAAIDKLGPLLHVDSDLRPFFARGGKLLLYIGWNDYHNPDQLAEYYKSLLQTAGNDQARNAVRLFIIPGMNHCAGGPGCDTFNKLGTIDNWATKNTPPETIVAARISDGRTVRTRPLCAYPSVAKFKGTGDPDRAESYTCSSPDAPAPAPTH